MSDFQREDANTVEVVQRPEIVPAETDAGHSDGTMGIVAGTGLGAISGAFLGSAGGPVGAIVGAIAGGVLGSAAGDAAHNIGIDLSDSASPLGDDNNYGEVTTPAANREHNTMGEEIGDDLPNVREGDNARQF